MENYIKIDNKHDFDKSNAIVAKKSKKDIIDARFDKKSNRSEAKAFQSIYQTNKDVSR